MASWMKLTEPSTIAKLAPPGRLLRKPRYRVQHSRAPVFVQAPDVSAFQFSSIAVIAQSPSLDQAGLQATPVNGSFEVLVRNTRSGLVETSDVIVDLTA